MRTLRELSRSYLTSTKDLARVMSRIKALYRSGAIPCSGISVYAPRHRAEWLGKIPGAARIAPKLKGGLAARKRKGYPAEAYSELFHLGGEESAAGERLGAGAEGLCAVRTRAGREQSCGCDALHVGSPEDYEDVRWGIACPR
jgi:hypothetical protein